MILYPLLESVRIKCWPIKPDPPKITTVFMIFLKLNDIASI
jgi:hypothetical protein